MTRKELKELCERAEADMYDGMRDVVAPASTVRAMATAIPALIDQLEMLREVLGNIALNADLIPDQRMNGSTDCYRVPLDDIQEACAALDAMKE